MRIAICEDNREHAQILENMVERWAVKENIQVTIGYYQMAEHFLFSMRDEPHYDLAFLDIQMEVLNGFELAKLIRKQDPTMFLVFTTGDKGYALRGYEVSAIRYLLKPLKEQDVISTLKKTNKMLEECKREAVIVTYNDELHRIYKRDIYYVEIDNHHIILHMKEREDIRFKAKMKEFEIQFTVPQFCKCHRSYLVNLHYVSKISRGGVLVDNGDLLPVSRARWDAINKCYMAYYVIKDY